MTEILLILGAIGLVAACGAFVAAEFALVTVDRATVQRAADEGDAGARGVQQALKRLSTQLSAAQLGITLTNLLIGFMAEPAIARLVDGPIESAGLPEDAAHGVAVAIALTLATGATMVFGELVPKNLAIAQPLATAKAVQGFLRGFATATAPLIRVFNGTANAVLHRLGLEPQEELASARSPEELSSLVRRSGEQGTLEPGTAALLQRSLAFGERRAHEIMTPRGRIVTVRADEPVLRVVEAARASGRSRFPVLDAADRATFAGVAHVKHAVGVPYEDRATTRVSAVMVAPLLVPASLELDDLLDQLRKGGLQMALVVDEFGNVDGLVTLEDLLEEIVGEVRDEHDVGEERPRREPDGSWSFSGLMRPDEVLAVTGVPLPEDEDYETVAGLIADRLGKVPEPGDSVRVDGHVLTVLALDGLRVARVRLAEAA